MICCAIIACLISMPAGYLLTAGSSVRNACNQSLAWRLCPAARHSPNQPAAQNRKFLFRARILSLFFAGRGLAHVIRHEHNAWIHIVAALSVIVLSLHLQISMQDWRWIFLAITLVIAAEAFNTAIEAACDAVTEDHIHLIRVAKDAAAGAVLIMCIGAVFIGSLTLTPYVFRANHVAAHQHFICGQGAEKTRENTQLQIGDDTSKRHGGKGK